MSLFTVEGQLADVVLHLPEGDADEENAGRKKGRRLDAE